VVDDLVRGVDEYVAGEKCAAAIGCVAILTSNALARRLAGPEASGFAGGASPITRRKGHVPPGDRRTCNCAQRRSIENSSTCVRRMLLPDGSRNDVSMP
jgi:hypothetical protein